MILAIPKTGERSYGLLQGAKAIVAKTRRVSTGETQISTWRRAKSKKGMGKPDDAEAERQDDATKTHQRLKENERIGNTDTRRYNSCYFFLFFPQTETKSLFCNFNANTIHCITIDCRSNIRCCLSDRKNYTCGEPEEEKLLVMFSSEFHITSFLLSQTRRINVIARSYYRKTYILIVNLISTSPYNVYFSYPWHWFARLLSICRFSRYNVKRIVALQTYTKPNKPNLYRQYQLGNAYRSSSNPSKWKITISRKIQFIAVAQTLSTLISHL